MSTLKKLRPYLPVILLVLAAVIIGQITGYVHGQETATPASLLSFCLLTIFYITIRASIDIDHPCNRFE